MRQPDVRWGHYRLRTIIGLSRDGENRLERQNRITLGLLSRICRAGVQRRKVFFWRIRDHLRAIERWFHLNRLLAKPGERDHPDQRRSASMQDGRCSKASPGDTTVNENIAP